MQERQDATEAVQVRDGERLAARWNDIERQARRLVDERPLTSVLAAVAAGYLAARLTSRL